jgi:hypothetical protein
MPRLNGVSVPANVDTVIYSAPSAKRATVTVSLCNRAQSNIFVSIGLCVSGATTLGDTDYIEFNVNISPGNTIERTGITPANGERIIIRTNQAGISAVVWGYEE